VQDVLKDNQDLNASLKIPRFRVNIQDE